MLVPHIWQVLDRRLCDRFLRAIDGFPRTFWAGWHSGCLSGAGMSAGTDELKQRAIVFAVDVLHMVDRLPRTASGQAVGRQLARSGSAVGANYRSACTARSRAEFIARLGVVVEEAEESVYWLDVILAAKMLGAADMPDLRRIRLEAGELLAIFARSVGTARSNSPATKK